MAIGQITITDMWDLPSLNAWIAASQPTTQTYNNTAQTWTPNYPSSAQVLTLNLTKAGSATSILGANVPNVKWYKHLSGVKTEITSTTTTDTEYKSGGQHRVLTIKVNVPTANNAVRYSVEGVYNDPDSGKPVAFGAEIDLTLVQLAKAAIVGNIYAPDGDFFRNGMPASLKINADLYKDGALSAGSKKFKWFKADSSVVTQEDADAGAGWKKITATTGTTGAVANSGFDVAVTTQGVLTVYPDAVTNGQTFLCVITDNAGGTSGTKVKLYLTLRDMDDPLMVVVDSSGGNIIKNGVGSTTLTARVFQNGEEVDTGGTGYTYKWSKWQNNVVVGNFGGTGNPYKTGKTLTVGSSDVDKVTTFKVEVS
jgi:hypothetical protein